MHLSILQHRLAICRLDRLEGIPAWASASDWFSITKTGDELSVVCTEDAVPPGIRKVDGWRALRVAGTMDLGEVGVLQVLARPLAEAGIALFAVSTFDTDYLLINGSDLTLAIEALRAFGHEVEETPTFDRP